MGLDARRANSRSVLIADVHISGADCTCHVKLLDLFRAESSLFKMHSETRLYFIFSNQCF